MTEQSQERVKEFNCKACGAWNRMYLGPEHGPQSCRFCRKPFAMAAAETRLRRAVIGLGVVGALAAVVAVGLNIFTPTILRAYVGPQRPQQEVALVFLDQNVKIVSANGFDDEKLTGDDYAEVLPGKVQLKVTANEGEHPRMSASPFGDVPIYVAVCGTSVDFSAEPNRSYRVRMRHSNISRWLHTRYVVTELSANRTVANRGCCQFAPD